MKLTKAQEERFDFNFPEKAFHGELGERIKFHLASELAKKRKEINERG